VSLVKNIEWDNMSNANIREKLMSLQHEHESLKNKMNEMTDIMESLEIEYLHGNEVIIKRSKGE
tara:strand:+ start:1381 stop:1572 length:192 start_codon:yes stop_codon:yes gene_type:complete